MAQKLDRGREETPSSAGREVAKHGGTGESAAALDLFHSWGAVGFPHYICPWSGVWRFWPQFFPIVSPENSPTIVNST